MSEPTSTQQKAPVTHNRLWCTMHPRGTIFWEPYARKSNKLIELHFHVSPWRAQTDAPNAKGQNTLSGHFLLSKIQPKQLMLGRDLKGRTKEKHKETPRSRSIRFPSLRGGMVWWNSRSRPSPSILQRSTSFGGGIGRSMCFDLLQQWRRERGKRVQEFPSKGRRQPLLKGGEK